MLSIIIPARTGKRYTTNAVNSALATVDALQIDAEFILIDDASDPRYEIESVFGSFAERCKYQCKIVRMPQWSHYVGSFARGMELASGNDLFLMSNDMMLTPDFLRTVLAVAALNARHGIVRGRSRFCDSHPWYNLDNPAGATSYDDVCAYSSFVAKRFGLAHEIDPHLSGDAILIRRAVVDEIGVFDKRFFGYFGDPDYGIRARIAGFELVCALGAWLHHEGGGHVKDDAAARGTTPEALHPERMALVEADYQKFRAKWGEWLPEHYDVSRHLRDLVDFDRIVSCVDCNAAA